MSLFSDFINNNNSVRNSKLMTALFMVIVFTVCSVLVVIGIPPAESVNVGTVLWVQGSIILGSLGINAAQSVGAQKKGLQAPNS